MTATKAEMMTAAACGVAAEGLETSIGKVCIKSATGDDLQFIKKTKSGDAEEFQLAERMIVACVCDESGTPIFKRTDADNISKAWTASAISEVAGHVRKHCGAWSVDSDAEGN